MTRVLYCYNQIINKFDFIKDKRVILIALAIVFLASLFLIKIKFLSRENGSQFNDGLSYDDGVLLNFVNKDADLDGVLDWEESLWGTDPNSKDTDEDGITDEIEIAEIKRSRGISTGDNASSDSLTKTDKFSRELFATVATLSQAGELDQATVDKLSDSLANQIKNSAPSRVYTSSNINVIDDNSLTAVKKYNSELMDIYKKYKIEKGALQILEEALSGDGTLDSQSLRELDPLAEKVNNIIVGMLEMEVPSQFSRMHLNLINLTQRCLENFKDIKFYDTDPIVALGGVSRYQENSILLDEATNELYKAILQKIK